VLASNGLLLPDLVELGRWAGACLEQQRRARDGETVEGVIVIPDSPLEEMAAEENAEEGLAAGGEEGVAGGDVTESDGELGVDVEAGTVPVKAVQLCKLSQCSLPVYVSREGREFEFCCRAHGEAYGRLMGVRPGDVCKLPGCQRAVYVDLDGVPYQFCCRSHGQEFARGRSGEKGGDEGVESQGVEEGPPEFQPGSELVCVRSGCFNSVQSPHAGVSPGRMGRGPTRYNFCCKFCKIQHGVGEGTIPFSTTLPLARVWYRGLVEAAQEEAGAADAQVDEVEAGEPEGGPDSCVESQEEDSPPLVVEEVPEGVVRSVMRCQGLMRRQMAKRASPYRAEYNGNRKCPICAVKFRIGHRMVRCFVDPDPECTWVHADCAQAIVKSRGGRTLHASLQ